MARRKVEEANELNTLLAELSSEYAERVRVCSEKTQWAYPHLHQTFSEADPSRANLLIIEKNEDGEPKVWVYGPYMVFRAHKPGWVWASLNCEMDAWGKQLYGNVPTEYDPMPMQMVLDKIDKALLKMKRGKKTAI